jgi:hypothetical protein
VVHIVHVGQAGRQAAGDTVAASAGRSDQVSAAPPEDVGEPFISTEKERKKMYNYVARHSCH